MIQVLAKAANLLALVSREPGADLKRLAEITALKKPGLLQMLQTLTEVGFLARTERGGYVLGENLRNIVRPSLSEDALVRAASVHAAALAEEIREQVTVARLDHGRRIIVARAAANQSVVVSTSHETRSSIYRTATGLVLLAHLRGEELSRALTLNGPPGGAGSPANAMDSFGTQLSEVVGRGFAAIPTADNQARLLAVPVAGSDGTVAAALGVSIPISRLTAEREQQILAEMRRAAAAITADMETGALI